MPTITLQTPDTEYYVDGDSGSDSNTGLSEGQAWATLAHASTTMTYGTITQLNVKVASTAYAADDWDPNNSSNNYLIVQGYTTSPGDGGKPTLQRTTGTALLTTGHADGNIAFRHLRFEDGSCAVNAYGRAWYVQCDFHDASVTGSRSVREDYHYVIGCTFTSTGDMQFAADATCKYCLFDGSNMTGQSYMVSRGGPEISDCVFIIKDGCGGFGNSHNKTSRLTRCLFLGDESGTGGRGGTGYEGNVFQGAMTTLTNCVFADLTTGIETIVYGAQLIGNNLFYNCGTNSSATHVSKIFMGDFVATEHPVPGRASGDYQIRVPNSLSYASGLIPSTFGPAESPSAPLAAKMVKLKHGGMLNPRSLQHLNYSPGLTDLPELGSTYTKIAYIGKFHHPQGPGSYDISRVGFYFGGVVTKTGGSGLTVSLQSVDQTTSFLTPSGTQDQTIDIANSDADFTTYSWYRTGTLSSNRTISHGDYVALVIEWDSSGHQGSDLVRFRQANQLNDDNSSGTFRYNGSSSSWGGYGAAPNCVFEMTDGSFGSFSDSFITDNFGTYNYDNADSPDEYANSYTPEATVKIDAFCGIFRPPTSEDLDLVIYEGTTAIHTTTVNGWQVSLNDNHYWTAQLDQEVQLEAHTKYYLALKPTQGTTTCRVYYRSVDNTNHLGIDPYSFGSETAYSRTDGGAWTQIPLRQLMLGVRVSSIDNGGTHGAFHPLGGN